MCLLPFCLEAMGSQGGRMTNAAASWARWWWWSLVVVGGGGGRRWRVAGGGSHSIKKDELDRRQVWHAEHAWSGCTSKWLAASLCSFYWAWHRCQAGGAREIVSGWDARRSHSLLKRWICSRYTPAPDRRALVFRNNRQNTFHGRRHGPGLYMGPIRVCTQTQAQPNADWRNCGLVSWTTVLHWKKARKQGFTYNILPMKVQYQ